jgi:hypothetical protein
MKGTEQGRKEEVKKGRKEELKELQKEGHRKENMLV